MSDASVPRRSVAVTVFRAIVRMMLGLALIAAAGTGAVLILFTRPAFDLLEFHPVALDYMAGHLPRTQLEQMVILGKSFSRSQIDHLDDVATLLDRLRWILGVSLAALAATFVIDRWFLRPAANLALFGLLAGGGVVVASYLTLGFQFVGIAFHEVVFPQGNWSFPWNSLIIELYGTDVMVKGAAFVLALGLGFLIAAYVATRFIPRRYRRAA